MADDQGKINVPEIHVISSDDENNVNAPDEPISVSSEIDSQDEQGAGNQAAGTAKTNKVIHKTIVKTGEHRSNSHNRNSGGGVSSSSRDVTRRDPTNER